MKKFCDSCQTVVDIRHRHGHDRARWSPDRDPAAHARFAREVKKRDGYRCTYVVDGVRCSETEDLHAHHLAAGYDPADGRTLCGTHHEVVDSHARRRARQ